jgi:hypothetical protein
MNERIRELAKQAGIKITPMVVDGIEYEYEDVEMDGSEDLEKFAELIVRECCLVLEQTQTALDRHKWTTPSECGIYIKEHFGVEE